MINKIVTFGEVLLRLTPPDYLKFSQTREFVATYGGSEANVAVSLANFGLNSEFVTRLPKNDIADACIKELRSHNVGIDSIVYGGDRLGIYFLENGAVARQSKVVYDRANSSFSTLQPGMIDWKEVLKDAQWFHWSGVAAAVSQGAADACMEGIKVADSMGLTISCDLNFRKNLWKYGKTPDEVMLPMVQYSDVIFGSEPEYEKVLGIAKVGFKAVTTDEKLDEDGFRSVGEQVVAKVPRCKKMFLELRNSINANHNTIAGVVYSDNTLKCSKIYDITHNVDRVGVGDAFCGGMIYGLVAYPGDDQKALDFAMAASCLKNTVYGDFNLVTTAEVENLMGGDGSGRVSR
ncbi:sugar kinase [uncultured Bacteroides sp.]|uniref:sugar kinase n=1 Tax=uncultured Bacteroides sp. TaxID=162156 RepID=UPI002AA7E0B3|nr:sugar kinase [uncultured Bacteroides sp.]